VKEVELNKVDAHDHMYGDIPVA